MERRALTKKAILGSKSIRLSKDNQFIILLGFNNKEYQYECSPENYSTYVNYGNLIPNPGREEFHQKLLRVSNEIIEKSNKELLANVIDESEKIERVSIFDLDFD